MTHSFNLVRPKEKESSIRLVVSHNGEKIQKCIGVVIRTALWNQKGRTPEKQCKDKRAWSVLGPIHSKLVEKEMTVRTRRDVMAAINYALGLENATDPAFRFWDYFKEWSDRDTPSKRFRQLAYKRISDIMGMNDDWEDIDGDWYFRFVQKMNGLGYSHNYKSTLTAKLCTVMNEAFNRGLHKNEAFRKFVTSYKTADAIALSNTEVEAIWGAELSGKESDARDAFIVGVYCAGRFQDYSRLSMDNLIAGGKLRYVQRKTGQTVIVPCSPRIKEVFARNGGRVPKITEQEVNRHIKDVCKSLGGSFNDIVEIRSSKGAEIRIKKKPRHELVSCHTARRTGASLLYLSGVPIRLCRFLTGHTTDSMFLNYVKVSKEEGADILANSDFFK